MEETLRLFKALPITTKREKTDKSILEKTIEKGFIFSPEVIYNYSENELINLIHVVEKEVGLSADQMNSSFHKSWIKIREASIEQLVTEQIIHYITTYGFEALGFYDKDSVYVPREKLEIPDIDIDDIKFIVIKGYTKDEIKEKVLSILRSGIALDEDTMKDILTLSLYSDLSEGEIETIRNKETKVVLYDHLSIIPESPIEFLRYSIYRATDKTLLIKDGDTISAIKASEHKFIILSLFKKYNQEHGLERLAEVFYRFKPLFLAFRTDSQMKVIVNKIRRLARDHHKPMKEDYLDKVTAKIKGGEEINIGVLEKKLSQVNTFRKIRLAYALKFRTKDSGSIMYKIRNGKAYATDFVFTEKDKVNEILGIVLESIIKDINPNVQGKKIYIPKYITYALPATEKQFSGMFPSGTCISIPKDLVVGVHWEDVGHKRIDLDLSLINTDGDKYGWDGVYRSGDRGILFSGDMTTAPEPEGASELFYVGKGNIGSYILFINYYNHDPDVEVPFKLFVAREKIENQIKNYIVDPNNVITNMNSKINKKQKILGLLIITESGSNFYFCESYLGRSITSSVSNFVKNTMKYLQAFHGDTISLNELLLASGAEIVSDRQSCDIDLSPENLEKDKIISLIKGGTNK